MLSDVTTPGELDMAIRSGDEDTAVQVRIKREVPLTWLLSLAGAIALGALGMWVQLNTMATKFDEMSKSYIDLSSKINTLSQSDTARLFEMQKMDFRILRLEERVKQAEEDRKK